MQKRINVADMLKSLKKLYRSGFFDIFGATLINSVVSFVYGIFIVRIMSQYDYGVFSYVQNISNFGVMFCCMGANLGILQFCSERVDISLKYSYSRYAAIMGGISSVLVIIIMVLYSGIDRSGLANLTGYIVEFSLLPVLYNMKDWITANLRWQIKNREYSIVLNIHSVANAVFAVLGAWIWGIHGVILGIYLAYICSILVGTYFLRGGFVHAVQRASKLTSANKNKFVKYSVTMCIVNALISVLYSVDLFVIGNIMQNAEDIAMYKTACVIPFALNMVPNSVMTFVYPHIAMHKEDDGWMKKNIKLLYLANGALNLLIGLSLFVGAPIIISILFGNRYEGILPVFRVLILSYILSACLRTPAANLFGMLRKTKTALIISGSTVVLSVCLGIVFVSHFGIIGAACGSVCTFGSVGIVSTAILIRGIYFNKK